MKKLIIILLIVISLALILLILNIFTDVFVTGPQLTDYVDYSFDSTKYYEIHGSVSPIIHLETKKAVLDKENCNRYSYWLTTVQREKIQLREEYPRSTPGLNPAIFPLMDYCLENGEFIKINSTDNIQWSYTLRK